MTYNSILCKRTGEEQYVHNIHNRNRHNRTDRDHHGSSNLRTITEHASNRIRSNPQEKNNMSTKNTTGTIVTVSIFTAIIVVMAHIITLEMQGLL